MGNRAHLRNLFPGIIPTRPQEPWQLSIQTSYCQNTSTHQAILCPHEQLPHSLTRAMKPSTHQGCAEILGDPYSKKSTVPSIGDFPRLANSPKLSSYQVLGQSRIQQRHITGCNHPRIEAQQKHIILENVYQLYLLLRSLNISSSGRHLLSCITSSLSLRALMSNPMGGALTQFTHSSCCLLKIC